jgi:predicted ATP-grasp superfamily ATP-dependent carboligase
LARVLVLDGHSAAALAFTRSLGQAKHWVAVGSNRGIHAPAEFSRYCRLSVRYPVPFDDASIFVEAILEIARKNAIDLIVPVTDWTIVPLSKYRDQFRGVSRLALGPHSAIELAADKFKTVTVARELQIRVPGTVLVHSVDELDAEAANFDFPVVVKDRYSLRWEGNRAIPGSVSYAYSPDDLKQKVQQRLKMTGDVLVQEFVPGEGIGFSCLAVEREICLPFMWLRLREIDPRGSGSSARRSIPINSEVREASEALVARVGLQGICMVEFKRPRNGDSPVLMEINGRPWGSLQLPIFAGIDYPVHLVDWLLNGRLPPSEIQYRQAITCRRLVSELTHLEHVFRGTPPGWPLPYPGFFQTLRKISVPWYPGMRYDDLWLSDPRPGVAGLAHWFRGHLNQLKSTARK